MAVQRTKAEYRDPVLPEYRGNPLIEALPEILSAEDTMRHLKRRARHDDAERQLDARYRIHCLSRLAHEYYQPLSQHFYIESKISVCIRQGYLNRNPYGREYALMANEMYAAMRDKRPVRQVPGYHPKASGFTIIGVSGVGKSTAVERILSLYPQVIEHTEYKGRPMPITQLSWLKLDCPHDGSLGGLCYSFFEKVDRILGTTYYDEYKRARITIDSMMILMERIAQEYYLGVLVIDELQHLANAKRGSDVMLNFFVTLVNTIGVPVILIGTSKAAPILQGEFRQARRGNGMGSLIWNRMEQDADWELLARTMWKYQWTREAVPASREMLDALYRETQGIVVLAVVLYALVQDEAILSEKETFDVEDIHRTAVRRMALVQPMIDAIRENDTKRIEQYADITTIVLDQFDRGHRAPAQGMDGGIKTGASGGKPLLHLKDEVLPFLLKLGIYPEKAEGLVEEAYRRTKSEDVKDVLSAAYELHMKEVTGVGKGKEDSIATDGEDNRSDLRNAGSGTSTSSGGLVDTDTW